MQADVALKLAFCVTIFASILVITSGVRRMKRLVCPPLLAHNRYALKGDAQMYGFVGRALIMDIAPIQIRYR